MLHAKKCVPVARDKRSMYLKDFGDFLFLRKCEFFRKCFEDFKIYSKFVKPSSCFTRFRRFLKILET